jgi:hypothetical protein
MPQLNEIRTAEELGHGDKKRRKKFIWSACNICGQERWVLLRRGAPAYSRCRHCASLSKVLSQENHPNWKGGRSIQHGYFVICLSKDDFFFPMATNKHYVLEHRLVMAKHLGRCLHPWEIVHHKNHIITDNRIENLQLVSGDKHKQITIMEQRIGYLEKRVTLLEVENTALREQIVKQKLGFVKEVRRDVSSNN